MDRLDDLVRELRAAAGDATEGEPPPQARVRERRPRTRRPVRRPALSRRQWLLWGVALAAVAVVLIAVGSGDAEVPAPHTRASASSHPEEKPAAFIAAPTPAQWRDIIVALDARRGRAFARLSAVDLRAVDAPGSSALRSDLAMLQALRASGAHAASFPLRVIDVAEEYVTIGERRPRAMLTVTDTMSAYDLVSESGAVLRGIPARSQRTWHVELQGYDDGWRFVSAVSAGSP